MANVPFTQLGALLVDLEGAYADRLAEAEEMLLQDRYGTAIALALYSLEIYLKVRICRRLDLLKLPKAFQTHMLDGLLVLSGLQTAMDGLGTHPVKQNWDFLSSPSINAQHVSDFRYKPNSTFGKAQAEAILKKIRDPIEGVMPWLLVQP
jgi:hypothetical protein